jgi:hypothetical protein
MVDTLRVELRYTSAPKKMLSPIILSQLTQHESKERGRRWIRHRPESVEQNSSTPVITPIGQRFGLISVHLEPALALPSE